MLHCSVKLPILTFECKVSQPFKRLGRENSQVISIWAWVNVWYLNCLLSSVCVSEWRFLLWNGVFYSPSPVRKKILSCDWMWRLSAEVIWWGANYLSITFNGLYSFPEKVHCRESTEVEAVFQGGKFPFVWQPTHKWSHPTLTFALSTR